MDAAWTDADAVAERFGRFARDEAPGRSDLYADWSAGVASDPAMCALLGRIPATHRQPPLVFAVTRMLGAPERGYRDWADWVNSHAERVVAECTRRSLQTNEPLRCAALLPALSGIAGPLALLEIGASAGLCLYPDRYSYRYRGGTDIDGADLDPDDGVSSVVLESAVTGDPPLRMPHVVWRAGIDLAPLDARDADDRRFLTSLVWPGEQGRAARIEAALDVVAADPPLLVRADATQPGVLERSGSPRTRGCHTRRDDSRGAPAHSAGGPRAPVRRARRDGCRVGVDRSARAARAVASGVRSDHVGRVRPQSRRRSARGGGSTRRFRGVARGRGGGAALA